VFEQGTPDFLDGGRLILTGMEAADDEFAGGVIHVRARIGDQAVLALVIIVLSLDSDDGVACDAGSGGNIRELQEIFVIARHAIEARGDPWQLLDVELFRQAGQLAGLLNERARQGESGKHQS
jgi:hypothetical protein